MGFTFHPIECLPEPGDVVWCKWPHRESKGQPGPHVRPVLVRGNALHDMPDKTRFGSLIVSYGTGVIGDRPSDGPLDLIIGESEFRALGLHKPTRFALDPSSKKNLPWCEEFFVPQSYVASKDIVIGRLNNSQMARLRECLKLRGLI